MLCSQHLPLGPSDFQEVHTQCVSSSPGKLAPHCGCQVRLNICPLIIKAGMPGTQSASFPFSHSISEELEQENVLGEKGSKNKSRFPSCDGNSREAMGFGVPPAIRRGYSRCCSFFTPEGHCLEESLEDNGRVVGGSNAKQGAWPSQVGTMSTSKSLLQLTLLPVTTHGGCAEIGWLTEYL